VATLPSPLLRTRLAGLDLASPVILAAGTAGVLDETAGVMDLSRVGAVTTKSITPEGREGNAPMRVAPVAAGMLNAIGLANPGIDRFVAEFAPRASTLPCRVIGSAAGFSVGDYERVAGALSACEGIDAVELNVSCPNVHGGPEFGADTEALGEVVAAARVAMGERAGAGSGAGGGKPLLVKLPPVAIGTPTDIVALARAAIEAGADALTLCNTMQGMAIDVHTRKPLLGNITGGLSGPALHPITLRLIHLVYQAVAKDAAIPIIGLGGVTRWEDAAAFILAGATAVGIGTAAFADTRRPVKIAKRLERWVRSQGVGSIADLTGRLEDAPPNA
jgi:dihydroorotate dehydrogenase (NAD+) catalytic subunit